MTALPHAQANLAITTISLIMAYACIVTLAHYFKAWVALCYGDETPAQLGFLSFNPLDHIDLVGAACLILFQIGWGRYVLVNPLNIHGRYRIIKIAYAYLSDSLCYIVIALLSLIMLITLFNGHIINLTSMMVAHGTLTYQLVATIYPDYNALLIAIGFILICFMYLGVTLGVVYAIINSFYIATMLFWNRTPLIGMADNLIMLIVPVVAILFLAGPLRLLVINMIAWFGFLITHLMGLI
jgi:hypothetical protein